MQITIHNPMTINADAVERLVALRRQHEPPDLLDVRTIDDHTVEAVATFSARGALCAARADTVAAAVGLAAIERDPTARTVIHYRWLAPIVGVYAWARRPYDPTYALDAFASSPAGFDVRDVQTGPRDAFQVRIAVPGEDWQTIETCDPWRAAAEAVQVWRQRREHDVGAVSIRAWATDEPIGAVVTASDGVPRGLVDDVLRLVTHSRTQHLSLTVAGTVAEMMGTHADGSPFFATWAASYGPRGVRRLARDVPPFHALCYNDGGRCAASNDKDRALAERVEGMRASAGVEHVEIGRYADAWASIARKGNRHAMAVGPTPTAAACDAIYLAADHE